MIQIVFGRAEKLGPMPPDANVRLYDDDGLWVGTESYDSFSYCNRDCAERALPWFDRWTDRYIFLDAVDAQGVPARDSDSAETADVYGDVEDPGYSVWCDGCGELLIDHTGDEP